MKYVLLICTPNFFIRVKVHLSNVRFWIIYNSVLTSVTNSVKLPSWFGGAKKDDEAALATEATESTLAPNQDPAAEKGFITPDKGSDASSATGGADSEKEVRKTNKVPPEVNTPTLCTTFIFPLSEPYEFQ